MNTNAIYRLPLLTAALLVVILPDLLSAQRPARHKHDFSEPHRFVFFAVLEGCYEDGLTQEAIDLIIPAGATGQRELMANFVWQCPLCGPAFDGFHVYSMRQRFANGPKNLDRDDPYNTFGVGLEAKVMRQLAESGPKCREAIQALIDKWVSARIERLRLNEEEAIELRKQLANMRKSGEAMLKSFQNGGHGEKSAENYKGWTSCPICSGASPASP